MNPERILIAAEAVGLGQRARWPRATQYAKERIVFNRPIGQNQAIQHPLAQNWMELEAAWLMTMSAAWQYDNGKPAVRRRANAAKYLARRGRLQCLPAGGDDPWRLRLRQGVPRRALPARGDDAADRADQPAARSCASSPSGARACPSRIDWGQDGPLAQSAGHDLNYIALSGALAAIGKTGEAPTIPLNLIGDFGGGGMLLALGILAAIIEAKTTGQGQVVDAAMVEGAATLLGPFFGLMAAGVHSLERGDNLLDGGAPFYDVYECKDGGYISLGPVEGKFQRVMLERLGFDPAAFPKMSDRANWDTARAMIAARVKEKTRDEWCAALEGSDACFAPVLDMREAPKHPHFQARDSFIQVDGVTQPAPVPRFSRTQAEAPEVFAGPGIGGRELLLNWGFDQKRIDALQAQGVIGAPKGA
jgi:hypothetical protein